MRIEFFPVAQSLSAARRELDEAFDRVVSSGRLILGREVAAFEEEFAAYCGVGHCVTVGNGLDALAIALKAQGVRPGDEVIVPGHTFIASWLAVAQIGAVPVGADVDPSSFNLDPGSIDAMITPRTVAIMPVHLYGNPAAMDEIEKPASKACERYALMRSLAGVAEGVKLTQPYLWDKSERTSIYITPCQELILEEAAELFRKGWATGKAQKRVMVAGLPYEGIVMVNPESLHKGGRSNKWKVKPFHSVDIRVTELKEGHSGKVPLYEVHGYDTKTGDTAKITSGISPEMFAAIKRAEQQYAAVVVEAEVSSLKDLKSANPTIIAVRYDRMGSPKQEPELVGL